MNDMRLGDLDVLSYKAKNEVLFLGRHSGKTQAQLEFIVNTLIENTPTIDAVPVVRCQYCAYFAEAKFNNKGFLICPASGMEITGMDYCSYGERKDGDGNG